MVQTASERLLLHSLDFSSRAKTQEIHASLPQAKRTGVWTADKPFQDSYQATTIGAVLCKLGLS